MYVYDAAAKPIFGSNLVSSTQIAYVSYKSCEIHFGICEKVNLERKKINRIRFIHNMYIHITEYVLVVLASEGGKEREIERVR